VALASSTGPAGATTADGVAGARPASPTAKGAQSRAPGRRAATAASPWTTSRGTRSVITSGRVLSAPGVAARRGARARSSRPTRPPSTRPSPPIPSGSPEDRRSVHARRRRPRSIDRVRNPKRPRPAASSGTPTASETTVTVASALPTETNVRTVSTPLTVSERANGATLRTRRTHVDGRSRPPSRPPLSGWGGRGLHGSRVAALPHPMIVAAHPASRDLRRFGRACSTGRGSTPSSNAGRAGQTDTCRQAKGRTHELAPRSRRIIAVTPQRVARGRLVRSRPPERWVVGRRRWRRWRVPVAPRRLQPGTRAAERSVAAHNDAVVVKSKQDPGRRRAGGVFGRPPRWFYADRSGLAACPTPEDLFGSS